MELNKEKQIEELVKVVRKLTYDLRTYMTSVTRYVRHDTTKKPPNLTEGQFIDRHLQYRDLALIAVNNILKCINENNELKEIENMRFENERYRKAAEQETAYNELYELTESYRRELGEVRVALAEKNNDIKRLTEENERLRANNEWLKREVNTHEEDYTKVAKTFYNKGKADTVRKMQQRSKEKMHTNVLGAKFLMLYETDIDQIAKDVLEGD